MHKYRRVLTFTMAIIIVVGTLVYRTSTSLSVEQKTEADSVVEIDKKLEELRTRITEFGTKRFYKENAVAGVPVAGAPGDNKPTVGVDISGTGTLANTLPKEIVEGLRLKEEEVRLIRMKSEQLRTLGRDTEAKELDGQVIAKSKDIQRLHEFFDRQEDKRQIRLLREEMDKVRKELNELRRLVEAE